MLPTRSSLVFGVWLGLCVAACSSSTGGGGEGSCLAGTLVCQSDELCFVDGRCIPRQPCATNSDCNGGTCSGGRCRVTDAGVRRSDGGQAPDGSTTTAADGGGSPGEDGGQTELEDGGGTVLGSDAGTECNTGDSQSCGSKVGVCRYGSQLCRDGRWGECVGGVAPTPEICDGLDNNCDGVPDNRTPPCECRDGTTQPCGSSSRGECRLGSQTCVNGAWATCVGNLEPAPRQCDDKDRDCDGTADYLQAPCACRNGTTQGCGSSVGVCRPGTQTCVSGQFGSCVNAVGPRTTNPDEAAAGLCNGEDDNCDGRVDEGCGCTANATRNCYSNVGECRLGSQTCLATGTWGACSGTGPTARQCDDKDRDCDGIADYLQAPCQCRNTSTRSCGSSVGECLPGTETCTTGQWGSCVGGRGPQPEICDNKDNDCDGTPDNGLRPPTAVACWTNSVGQLVCSDPNNSVIAPLATVQLDGRQSSDPDGQSLSYSWRLGSAPAGSTIVISNPSSARPTLFAQLAGDYLICLTVTDTTSCRSQERCVTMHVVPTSKIHIQLVWDKDETDVDLHFMLDGITNFLDDGMGPPGGMANCSRAKDCSFICRAPSWGGAGSADDPSLDIDDLDGFGPENVNVDAPANQNPFVIAVHYWCDRPGPMYLGNSRGASTATVRLYIDGILRQTWSKLLTVRQLWYVGDIAWNNATTPSYVITTRDTVQNTAIGCAP